MNEEEKYCCADIKELEAKLMSLPDLDANEVKKTIEHEKEHSDKARELGHSVSFEITRRESFEKQAYYHVKAIFNGESVRAEDIREIAMAPQNPSLEDYITAVRAVMMMAMAKK